MTYLNAASSTSLFWWGNLCGQGEKTWAGGAHLVTFSSCDTGEGCEKPGVQTG